MANRPSPAEAWQTLLDGNARFTRGEMAHPSQDVDRRTQLSTGVMPRGFVRAIVDRVIPSIVGVGAIAELDGDLDPEVLRREHVRATVRMLQDYSISLATAAVEGRCAIVGAEYALADGTVSVVETVGSIG